MVEALWSVEFMSNVQGAGAGIAVFETGRVLGGDAAYTYIGNYKAENGKLIADLKIANYRGQPHSVFGLINEFNLHLEGVPNHDVFEVQGHMVEKPALKIGIRLTRRAELP